MVSGMVVLLHAALLYALQSGLTRDNAPRLPQKIVFAEILVPPQAIPEPPPLVQQSDPPLPARPPEPLPPVKKPKPAPPMRRPDSPRSIVRPRAARPPVANLTPSHKAITLPVAAADPAPRTKPAAPMAATPATPSPLIAPRFDVAYLNNPKPAYPALARRMGEEGKAVLRVCVTAEGRAGDVRLYTGSGSPRLDEAAIKAVWAWRFVPARQGDHSIEAWVLVPISFKLD